jgi:hypothetical protein
VTISDFTRPRSRYREAEVDGNSTLQITTTKILGVSVQVSAAMFLFPETRHLTPNTLRFGAWDLGFRNIDFGFEILHSEWEDKPHAS